jgi:hypothetical protein
LSELEQVVLDGILSPLKEGFHLVTGEEVDSVVADIGSLRTTAAGQKVVEFNSLAKFEGGSEFR